MFPSVDVCFCLNKFGCGEYMSWIDDAVIYQVNLRSLAAREPRNAIEAVAEVEPELSPLEYLTANLEKISELGVNLIYLVPPYPIGVEGRKGIGSPYSSRDFMAVESEYGTLDNVKELIRRTHELGLRIIFDITPNHTSRDHVWTQSKPDYYVHRDDGSLFYDFDWSDVAKLNYRNPDLRRAMIDVFDFWLSVLGQDEQGHFCGIDGFRLDMAHMLNDLSFWNEAMVELSGRHSSRELLFLAESYGTPRNLDLFERGVNAAYDDDFYKLCQYLYAVDGAGATLIDESPEAAYNGDFSDKLRAFRAGGIAAAALCCITNYADKFAAGAGPRVARYSDNHDEGRGLHRFGAGAVMAVNRLLFMSPNCIPFILTGQEFGALNRPSIHERFNICDKGPRVVCNGETSVQPGIEFEGNLFARSRAERQHWYEFYRELIMLRSSTPALRYGDFAVLNVGEDAADAEKSVVAFERSYNGKSVRCAVNLGGAERVLGNAGLFSGEVLYGGLRDGRIEAFGSVVVAV